MLPVARTSARWLSRARSPSACCHPVWSEGSTAWTFQVADDTDRGSQSSTFHRPHDSTQIRWNHNRLIRLNMILDRHLAMVAPVCSIIDDDHTQPLGLRQNTPSDDAEQSVVAERQHEPLGEPGTGSATQWQTKMVNDLFKEHRSASTVVSNRSANTSCRQPATPHWQSPHPETRAYANSTEVGQSPVSGPIDVFGSSRPASG